MPGAVNERLTGAACRRYASVVAASAPRIPPLIRVRRFFDGTRIGDVAAETRRELAASGLRVRPGASIAVAVGSRGIADGAVLVRETVRFLREAGAHPFLVPAMGSHGGATAEGQKAVLAGYGITEEAVGAPVRSSMEVVELPPGPGGPLPIPVFMDRLAWESDGVVLINRVKPHTSYHGFPESGLMKMAVIGLGKHAQALAVHARGVPGLKTLIAPAARRVFSTGRVVLGIAVVENAYDRICALRALLPGDIERVEKELLALAASRMPALPVPEVDVLLVDEIGKDVSGVGMDPNVIGRLRVRGEAEPSFPAVRAIVACGLTEATHGNANGMGLADVITRRLADAIDFDVTYANTLTSTFLERGKMPLAAPTDRRAAEIALETSWLDPAAEARVIRIQSTLRLASMHVSRPVLEEMRIRERVETEGEFADPFDGEGRLLPFGE